jgi:ABC-type glycerol-3-phosphate transport system substrate-binding protein
MKKKLILLFSLIVICMLFVSYVFSANDETYSVKAYEGNQFDYVDSYYSSYKEYLKEYTEAYPNQEIEISAIDYLEYINDFNDETVYKDTFLGKEGIYIPETADVSWEVTVNESGYYNLKIEYLPVEGRSSSISRGIQINKDYPFIEAENFTLSRIWMDEFDVETKRVDGEHDLKPKQIEKSRWNEEAISDNKGYYNGEAYYFYFTAGTNRITLTSDSEPVVISKITLYQSKEVKTYDETIQAWKANGYLEQNITNETGNYNLVQGENAYEKSSPILSPVANWSSYKVDPYEKFMMRYNTIGGTVWRVAGDWISWEINVPKAGLYKLTFKINQSYNQGMVSNRILKINNEVPFEEAYSVEFKYDSDWQNVTIGNGDEDYWFYLNEGTNTITLQNTIGIYSDVVSSTEYAIELLTGIYRDVVMIAGTNPDQYQDYMLYERISDLSTRINESIEKLSAAREEIIRISNGRSSMIASFEKTLYLLNKFVESEKNIQTGLNEMDDNISALGTWVMTVSEQPLSVDCIYVHGDEVSLPKASTNFFQKFWHELVMLFGSYGANTSLESNVECDGPTITVWIMTGRDQSQLLRQIIDEQFSLQNNINVELKLVTSTALLPATLSGNGPDVALGVAQNIPVNWGIRNAVVDLTTFDDYEEIANYFHQSAITPFEFMGNVYGLPDTQDFLVTFVRDDIVEELEIEVPETWEEVINLLPGLQRQYLDYYIMNTKGTLSTVMYSMIVQNGGSLYNENGSQTLLLEENATDAFIDFTRYFSDFGFAISANFANRFRSGEMPLGITNFSLYNTLAVFAPEIKGQWSFDLMPGYERDGVIHNQSASTSTGTIILSNSKQQEASWEFVKWWLGEEAQTSYARGMEAILGAAARYPTANLDAFKNLPWSAQDYQILSQQRETVVGIPTVPGDYIIGRYIDNAFRATINDGTNPRDNLFEYVTKINIELERKRQEFNLD